MEKTLGVAAIVLLLGVVLINAVVDSIGYITDIIGEIVLVCAIPFAVLGTIFMTYRMFIGCQEGRINSIERSLYNERLAIENEAMRKRMEIVNPVGNVLPVAYDEIVSGRITGESMRLLESSIDAGRTHPNVPNSIHYSVKNDNNMIEGQSAEGGNAPAAAPNFGELYKRGVIGRDEIMLGYTADGPIYASPHKLKSLVCGGLSGSGKSNTTRFLLSQYAMLGWKLAIFDPHGNSEEGILPSLMPLSNSFFFEPATEFEDGIEMLRCVMAEGERRASITGSKQSDFEPLLFVIDEVAEFAAMASDEERAYAEKNLPVILKSFRKFNIFGFCISQFWSQSDMGRLGFLLRRASQTSIIHRMPEDGAKIIERFGDFRAIDNLPTGTCLLNNTDIKSARLQIPLCDKGHIEEVLPTSTPTSDPTSDPTSGILIEQKKIDEMEVLPPQVEVGVEVDAEVGMEVAREMASYFLAAEKLTTSQRMRIEDALEKGYGNGQIIMDVFEHESKTSGRKGQQYARMINGVRLEMGMDLPYSPARANKL